MSTVRISRKLEILPGNKVQIPGCEPTSAITSPRMFVEMRALGLCKNAIVSLDVILAAIPGATVEFGSNFNAPRQKWLVLPPFDPSNCPSCVVEPDWYAVLRDLASEDETVTESFDTCNTVGMGYCPSPGWQDTPAPQADPYFNEGENSILSNYTP